MQQEQPGATIHVAATAGAAAAAAAGGNNYDINRSNDKMKHNLRHLLLAPKVGSPDFKCQE